MGSVLVEKKLIGYQEIFAWIKEKQTDKTKLIETIQNKTRQYAKRQVTFWKKFRRILKEDSPQVVIEERMKRDIHI